MNRIEYIDSAKGVLIILIILGHVFFKEKIMYFAYTFSLTSFFVITGILFFYSGKAEKPFVSSVKGFIYTLAIPFFFFEAIGGVVKKIVKPETPLLSLIDGSITGNYNVNANWYLQAAFFAEVLFLLIEKSTKNKYLKVAIYTVLYIIGCCLPREEFCFRLTDRILICTALIAAGFYLYSFYMKLSPYRAGACFIISCICTVLNRYVSLFSIQVGNPVVFFAGTITGAYFCISMCRLFPSKLLALVGKNSLILMGTHQLFIYYLPVGRIFKLCTIALAEIPIVMIIRRYFPFCVGIKKTVQDK